MIEVVDPGGLTTVQDSGRPGWAHLGVPVSGAADAPSLRLANRLVGNPEDAPALETTLRGPTLRFTRPALIALTGAPVDARADDRPLAMHAGEFVGAGDVVRVGLAQAGVRTYLAVRGGIEAERVFGSASTDILTGLGPPPLERGAWLDVGKRRCDWPAAALAPMPSLPPEPVLRVVPGPREDWFTPDARERLTGTHWEVTTASNRIGVRLGGGRLERARSGELESEGMLPGALQVPPAGAPIVLLNDHPTTGGYPVLAVVATADLPLAGQLRPGTRVRFALA